MSPSVGLDALAALAVLATAAVVAPRGRPARRRRATATGGALTGQPMGRRAPALVERWSRPRRARARTAALPELVDLFWVAASAGLSPASCVLHVAPRVAPPLDEPLRAAAAQLAAGAPLAPCLASLGAELGSGARPLVAALADAATRGTPLAPSLAAAAADARDARRRHAQEQAQRLPVSLLFPLVLCTLPAAVLGTVVPVVVVALRSLTL